MASPDLLPGHPDTVQHWHSVREQIAHSALKAGRDAVSVNLVAVSKTFSASAITPVLDAGQRLFGENRVQEASAKWPTLRAHFPDIELHLIGPLQSNKVREAVALFDVIETVDRPKIATALATEMKRQNRFLPCLVQVNIGNEPQKAGIAPDQADGFIQDCREQGLAIAGLMCIPPVNHPPGPFFETMQALAQRHQLHTLSMGMSADYSEAIRYGATHVRVGSAIFGHRTP
ncbi:YggS family pyridoxal phosphate-dependent enzyme [Haematospirillum sp. H1815]|uniref:YggS family pyridoxal phosphate-dependent enzyme n=1 Tax=Haematospirillum sp. H1815 TaxID=2723108 RepID=UPI00143CBCD3|nr:YggS family pyridoxal phosphate-dependent enzyme [Haematospirillum sp. H1815]NKD77047.1 YggS family pyridoxal phosphate-dependent enzyme [Haematospirillum sp. H1815]